jgi:protein TonB
MFDDSLLEFSGRIGRRRQFATAASLVLQSLLIGTLILLPLLSTENLHIHNWPIARVLVPPPLGAPPESPSLPAQAAPSNFVGDRLPTPPRIPSAIANIVEDQPPPTSPGLGVPYGVPQGRPEGVLESVLTPAPAAVPRPPATSPKPVCVSRGVAEGLLLYQVKPAYPPLAAQTHTQGEVMLHAVIGRDGTIASLQVVRGHPLLAPAAVAAVREWRYRPYTLNGEPVEVETFITVRFVLSGN